MNYSFLDFLTLVGSLGLFLFGMKMMSEALQKVAGDKMRKILSAMTSNRVFGVITGFLVTTIIQSSSATTVMVVSFVNAGLVNLTESVGVIMGANVGTTITGWIITLFGFKVKISTYALPLIGFGLPLIFSKTSGKKSWGEFLIGFALLFIGLEELKGSVPDIRSNPEILAFVSDYTNLGFGSVLIFLAIGTLLTIIIQSSSATMALTFVMCNQGWIAFDLAAAMVLGENIGTTITANMAAAVGNVSAKRAARAHLIFNLMGVIWMLIVFYPFTDFIDHLLTQNSGTSLYETPALIPAGLSIFHTTFNILNMLIFIGFVPILVKLVIKMVPQSSTEEEEFTLKYITTGMLSTSELSVLQAKKEIQYYAKLTGKMFGFVEKLFHEEKDKKFNKLYSKIEKYEKNSDAFEVEIANYLGQISQGKLSDSGRRTVRSLLKLVSEIESIADSCYNLARTINRMREKKIVFDPSVIQKLELMYNLVSDAVTIMRDNLEVETENISLAKANQIEDQINNYRNQLKVEHLDNLKNSIYTYEAGIIFNDIFSECEKLGDYIINVSESIDEISK